MIEQAELVDLLFSGLAERPVWQTFQQRLAQRLSGGASAMIISASNSALNDGSAMAPIGMQERFVALVGAPFLNDIPFELPRMLSISDPHYAQWNGASVLRLRLDTVRSMWLVTCRRDDGENLAPDWSAVLAKLQPYLTRIMKAYLAIAESERRRLIAEYVLESSGFGVILVDETGAVIHANAAADALLADTKLLSLKDGRIFASRAADHKALMEEIRTKAAEQSATGRPDCYSTLALVRSDHALPITAIIRPGPPFAPLSAPLFRTAVIVLRDPARRNTLVAADIERLFKLSPAESRLAGLLAEGVSTEEAALQLGVSKHTVRSQLQSIFAKTGTSRQGELVRMLLSSAATLTQSDDQPVKSR